MLARRSWSLPELLQASLSYMLSRALLAMIETCSRSQAVMNTCVRATMRDTYCPAGVSTVSHPLAANIPGQVLGLSDCAATVQMRSYSIGSAACSSLTPPCSVPALFCRGLDFESDVQRGMHVTGFFLLSCSSSLHRETPWKEDSICYDTRRLAALQLPLPSRCFSLTSLVLPKGDHAESVIAISYCAQMHPATPLWHSATASALDIPSTSPTVMHRYRQRPYIPLKARLSLHGLQSSGCVSPLRSITD